MRLVPPATVVVLLVALCAAEAPAQSALDANLEQAIDRAIERGIAWIWAQQKADGTWGNTVPWLTEYNPDGDTALMCYPLLEAGVSAQDERLAKALDWLAKHDAKYNYVLSLRCQNWLIANKQTKDKYRKEFEADVKALQKEGLRWEGKYTYQVPAPTAGQFDSSNCQFGVLGVWAGARANMEFIDETYWWKVIKVWMERQCPDGGWDYLGVGSSDQGNASMTAAGVATLFVCVDNLLGDAFIKCDVASRQEIKVIERGLNWLDVHFEDTLKPKSEFRAQITGLQYYLYCLERVGLASGLKYFGKSDWYREGAKALLKEQDADGGWTGGMGARDQSVAFAILFLVRGRNPVLFNKLQYDGDWNNRPRALAALTEWISRSFEATVNWQIVTLKSPVSDWHDAPILYLSGSKAPNFSDEDLLKLKAFVQQGGTIFSVTECSGAAFNKGMRQAYAKMFPDYEIKPAEKDHELYSLQYHLAAKPRFHVLSNGVRPLAIHVEEDMSLPWQRRQVATEAWAYQGAANVFLYVTDKGSLKARGTNRWPEEPAAAPAKKVKVARIKYGGNWDPEPLAYERLGRLMARNLNVGLDVSATEIKGLSASGAAVATITGTSALSFSAEEREALKKFVEGGGTLLLDAAGGSQKFATSAEALVNEMFGGAALKRLFFESPLYAAPAIKEFKYRKRTRERLSGMKDPTIKGVTVGDRLAVLFSREDLTGGLVGYASRECDGYDPQTAYEIVRNVMLLATGGAPGPATSPASAPASESGR